VNNLNISLIRKGCHDNEININNLTRYENSAYHLMEAGSWYLLIKVQDLTIHRAKITLKAEEHYTFVLSGRSDHRRIFVYTDDLVLPKMGYAKFRFIHQIPKRENIEITLNEKKLATLKYGEESPLFTVKITDLPEIVLWTEGNKREIAKIKLYL